MAAAIGRCVAETFRFPDIFGLETVSIAASVATNWTLDVPQGDYTSHNERFVTGLDFCNVSVITTHPGWNDTINTQVWLPLKEWNGRMHMTGGSGLTTGLVTTAMTGALDDGYASVSTDGGHEVDGNGSWMLPSPGNVNLYKLMDYADTSLQEAPVVGRSITEDFYERPPEYSYFSGCSTGGRQGLWFAQFHPRLFDGILACAPAIRYNDQILGLMYPLINIQDHGTYPRQCELITISQVALDECDLKDGVKDGMISAPEHCSLDPFSLVGTPATNCSDGTTISEPAAFAANGAWTGTGTEAETMFLGLEQGADLSLLVNTTCNSSSKCEGAPFSSPLEWWVYGLKQDPEYDFHDLTVREMLSIYNSPLNRLYSAIFASGNLDLSTFGGNGGKMITWHGLTDEAIPPKLSKLYYDRMLEIDPDVGDFYRYFQVPGVNHCGGGNGPYPGEAMQSLVKWVENGVAPDYLDAISAPDTSGVAHERPICAYPIRARYNGQGDVTRSENWQCK
jgi:hypothetical protein